MRSEFKEFYEAFPDQYKKKGFFARLREKRRIANLDRFIQKHKPSSEEWHAKQQELSLLSCSSDDSALRSRFYEKTLKNCKGKLYALPGISISFPSRLSIGVLILLQGQKLR